MYVAYQMNNNEMKSCILLLRKFYTVQSFPHEQKNCSTCSRSFAIIAWPYYWRIVYLENGTASRHYRSWENVCAYLLSVELENKLIVRELSNSGRGVVLLQSSYYSKLEKADILEMTVKYLNSLKRQRLTGSVNITTPSDVYSANLRSGLMQENEIQDYIGQGIYGTGT